MRLSEVLGRTIVDQGGREIGRVHDVRLVQDGPVQGFDAGFRLHGLIAGPGSVGTRLGYGHGGTRGPWLIRMLFERRRALYVPWERVDQRGEQLIFDGERDELDRPAAVAATAPSSGPILP
jgi:sporulation protein YlmC with PRC-barrel domain